jgi:alpha-tubulin suppressor-like RCC1 family protein
LAWGRSCLQGQLGLGLYTSDQKVPVTVLHGATAVAAGRAHSLALTSAWSLSSRLTVSGNGQVLSWGQGRDGELGHGVVGCIFRPKLIEAFQQLRIQSIFAADHCSFALARTFRCAKRNEAKGGNTLFAFGYRHGLLKQEPLPSRVDTSMLSATVTDISCGERHILVLCSTCAFDRAT